MDEGVPVVKTCCAHRERMTVVTMTGTLKSAVRSRERGHAVTSVGRARLQVALSTA